MNATRERTHWTIERLLDGKGQPPAGAEVVPLGHLGMDPASKRLVLEPRFLDYGTYRVRFNTSMVVGGKGVNGTVVENTHAELEGFFLIQQCDIRGQVDIEISLV